jgi:hypothetical protein
MIETLKNTFRVYWKYRNDKKLPYYRVGAKDYIKAIRFVRDYPQSAEIIFQEGVEFERNEHSCDWP